MRHVYRFVIKHSYERAMEGEDRGGARRSGADGGGGGGGDREREREDRVVGSSLSIRLAHVTVAAVHVRSDATRRDATRRDANFLFFVPR